MALPQADTLSLRPNPHLYEINTWPWLERLSAQAGRSLKLGDVPDDQWDWIGQRGFDVVWLMGVWQRSPESRRIALADSAHIANLDRGWPGWKPTDVIASPYAVTGYVPDERIGSWDDIDGVRTKLHDRGIQLWLDFVGNHTALDHPWSREHPEFYVQGTQEDFKNDPGSFYRRETVQGTAFLALGRDPYFPPWRDTLQLNHFHPEMRAAQLADLRTIAKHCDGVRCDMAMLHLKDIFARIWSRFLRGMPAPATEFWTDVHAEVPDLILLAEAYWGTETRLLDLGFSFVYDKELYDAIRDIRIEDVHARLSAEVSVQKHFARFLENHDEPRSAATFGKQRLSSVATLMGTVPGMRFYYQDEIRGCLERLPITWRLPVSEPPDPNCLALFERILQISNQDVFHHGSWRLLPTNPVNDGSWMNLFIYEWRGEKAWKVVAVNLSGVPSHAYLQFEPSALSDKDYLFYDELHDIGYRRSVEELHEPGLYVRLEGFQAHLFDVTPV